MAVIFPHHPTDTRRSEAGLTGSLVFSGWFVGDWLSWQTPGALSPDLEDLL
jgi:hypothetical protein